MSLNNHIQDILDNTQRKILQRGEEYYENDLIESLVKKPNGDFEARVWGSNGELYECVIEVASNDEITDYNCDCPYDYDDVCKHTVAVLLAIQDGKYEKNEKQEKQSNKPAQSIEEVVFGADEVGLREFVAQYAKADDKFKNKVMEEFGQLETDAELARVKAQIRSCVKQHTRGGYIDYSDCDDLCDEFDDILSVAEKRIAQGNAVLGFLLALHILLTSVELAAEVDSSSGALTNTIEYSLELIDNACENVDKGKSDDDKNLIYDQCVEKAQNKVFDDWGTWNYTMLRSCARLVTDKNVKKIMDALDYLAKVYGSWLDYYIVDDKLTRLEIMKHLEGETAAKAYIRENINFDAFRHLAIEQELEEQHYTEAERLCIERITNKPYSGRGEWFELLYSIYDESDNTQKQIDIAKQLVVGNDLRYYDCLKNLLIKVEKWEEEYPVLLSQFAKALPSYLYMEILKRENELCRLFEEVKKCPEVVFAYGKLLAQKYPNEVYAIFKEHIKSQAKAATDRGKYRKVCDSLKVLVDAKGKEVAVQLVAEFKGTYNRRPAMLDELGGFERWLTKQKNL